MINIDLIKTATEQKLTIDLDGTETELRVYWVETPKHMVETLGIDGQLFMDLSNEFINIKSIALTTGNELMLPYGLNNFGGFICTGKSICIDNCEWNLYYIEISELDEIRKAYGSIV